MLGRLTVLATPDGGRSARPPPAEYPAQLWGAPPGFWPRMLEEDVSNLYMSPDGRNYRIELEAGNVARESAGQARFEPLPLPHLVAPVLPALPLNVQVSASGAAHDY